MLAVTGRVLAASADATLPGRPAFARSTALRITQVRNATLRVEMGGVRFLIDPMLAEQGAYPGFDGTVNSELRIPVVPLTPPMDEEKAIKRVARWQAPTPPKTGKPS